MASGKLELPEANKTEASSSYCLVLSSSSFLYGLKLSL